MLDVLTRGPSGLFQFTLIIGPASEAQNILLE